ncbi:MAG TPA: hypothetical protein VKH81_18725 [Candidatus Angelobacter sp.]|nr:hypothetical protein [Candidatus Angelobacter sp.]
MHSALPSADSYLLWFPAILFVLYLLSWLAVGRDSRVKNVVPQYEPPPGVSPGVARYIITGGSDGTTLASVLASLAAKGVIAIQPVQGSYQLQLLNPKIAVAPEEAALAKTLFNAELPCNPYVASGTSVVGTATVQSENRSDRNTFLFRSGPRPDTAIFGDDVAEAGVGVAVARSRSQAVVDPAAAAAIKYHLDAIQDTFRKNLQGIYFRQNFIFSGIGTLATFVWALIIAASIQTDSSMFLTFWLLMFTSISGLVIGGSLTSKPTYPTLGQRMGRLLLPLIFFAAPGAMIYFFALPKHHTFVIALLLAVLLNNVFFVIMRAPTALGNTTLQQLAGFREFLLRVEQDRLDRVNSPGDRAELMNRFLPYAIALGVREGWGDTMAAAFSNAIVER